MLTRLRKTLAGLRQSSTRRAKPRRDHWTLLLESLEERTYMHGEPLDFASARPALVGPTIMAAEVASGVKVEPNEVRAEVSRSVESRSINATAIGNFIRGELSRTHLAGVSVAVVRGEQLLFSAGYGKANLSTNLAMTSATPQLLASVSKAVTAVAAMQLVEKGLLNLDADLNRYLPFAVRNPHTPSTPITARMLMTHTSSIVDNDTFSSVAYSRGDSPVALGSLLRNYLVPGGRYYDRDNFLASRPGRAAEYSNMGTALLGYVVEAVSHQPFDRYCRDQIFTPLKMSNTSWKLAGANLKTLAMPYEYSSGRFVAEGHYGFPDYPNGQLRSSALDMSRFLRAFINDGRVGGARILSAKSVAEMRRLQILNLDNTQGLIWFYDTLNGQRVLGHDGGEQGVNTLMFYRPQDGVGVLVFSNTSAASGSLQSKQDAAIRGIAGQLLRQVPISSRATSRVSESAEEASPPVARIVNGDPTTDFAAVGMVGDSSGGFCSGTLIAPRYVLTAGHCGEGLTNTQGRFFIGGKTYTTSRVIVHPQYDSNTLDNDLAIFELSQPATGVTPSPIYRGTPRVGELLTLVGFGGGGTGTAGHNGDFGVKRVGTTPIDGVEATLITWNFDNSNESNTAPGDSGGPAYLKVNNVYYVAGVTSGGTQYNAGIGDHSYDTRVDAYQTWIDSITGKSTTPPASDDHVNSPGSSATPIALTGGQGTATGKLEKAGDRDVFKFTASQAGTATIKLTGKNGLDTYLRVYDSAGNLIAENNDFGGAKNSQVALKVKAGIYYVSAAANLDKSVGQYEASVNLVNDMFADPTHVSLKKGKGAVKGNLATAGGMAVFDFVATRAGAMTVVAKRASGNLDTMLSIYDAQGKLLASNDDYGNSLNSRLTLSVTLGQKYFAVVKGYDDTIGKFKLSFTTAAGSRSLHTRVEQLPATVAAMSDAQYVAAVDDLMCMVNGESRSRRTWHFMF